MADGIQNFMRMHNIFGVNPEGPREVTPQINLNQPSMDKMFSPAAPQQDIPTIGSRQFPQRGIPDEGPQLGKATAWDEFLNSVMNPPQRTNMTYPDSTLNVMNAALKAVSTPSAYDKNRVFINGNPYQKQKTFKDIEGKQHFITDVKKPGFMEPVMEAWSQQGTAPTDILNQPYQDELTDWKLRTEGLKTVAAAEANQALAQQRMANATIGIPGVTGARVMDAQTRAKLAALKNLDEKQRIQLIQSGQMSLAEYRHLAQLEQDEINNAASMDRTNANNLAAGQRNDASIAGRQKAVETQQSGANYREGMSQSGADRRSNARIAADQAGGPSETQMRTRQQRVANEIIREYGLEPDDITFDENGYPVISRNMDVRDRSVILKEFNRRFPNNPPQELPGATPPSPAAPPAQTGGGPQPPASPANKTPRPGKPIQQKAAPITKETIEMVTPDGKSTRSVPLDQVQLAESQGLRRKK